MLLSKLVFLSVKNVLYLGDTSFNYDGFCAGDFDNDIDYATNINNVFSPLNEAIARLSDLNRIPYVVEKVQVGDDRVIDLSQCEKEVKEVVGVAEVYKGGSFKKLSHVPFGKDKIRITSALNYFGSDVYIEYKENIKDFSKIDIKQPEYENGELVDKNIDLFSEYGIDNSAANYIMEYVQGKLLEPTAPELANMHITRAEAYFNNLDVVKRNFPQECVDLKYRMGE